MNTKKKLLMALVALCWVAGAVWFLYLFLRDDVHIYGAIAILFGMANCLWLTYGRSFLEK